MIVQTILTTMTVPETMLGLDALVVSFALLLAVIYYIAHDNNGEPPYGY